MLITQNVENFNQYHEPSTKEQLELQYFILGFRPASVNTVMGYVFRKFVIHIFMYICKGYEMRLFRVYAMSLFSNNPPKTVRTSIQLNPC